MKGNNLRPWTDQVAAGGRPRVHRSLEHTFKDKVTAETGKERHSAASTATDFQISMSHPSCRGRQEKGCLCLLCTAGHKSLGTRMEM